MLDTSKKIIIVAQENICHNTGGSITCTATLANLLANNGYEVKCIHYSARSGEFKLLNNNVELINLYDKYSNKSFSEATNLFVEKHHPDLIIFFFPHLYVKVALDEKFKNITRILMFHSRPDWYFSENKLAEQLKKIYVNTTSVILFDSYYNLLPKFIRSGKVITIPNAIKHHQSVINTDTEHKKIVFFSRIDCYKGIEFLLKSFKLAVKKYLDWQLDLYGDIEPAEYKKTLETIINDLELKNNVHLKGIIHNPPEVLKEYDFSVFPSYFEGFPIGLLEMQSIGLPCIGLKGCSGVNELIKNNYNGFLTNDKYTDFAKKIEKLIKNKSLRKKFSKNALLSSGKYDTNFVNDKWLDIINKILNHNPIHNTYPLYSRQRKHLFAIDKIKQLFFKKKEPKWYQYIFSVKNSENKTHKLITILGIKIRIKNKK